MGLPPEMLIYAENLWRRFPEEFVALGMPNLEHVFDLRPDGTKTRRIFETATEKTIEITIRRRPYLQGQGGAGTLYNNCPPAGGAGTLYSNCPVPQLPHSLPQSLGPQLPGLWGAPPQMATGLLPAGVPPSLGGLGSSHLMPPPQASLQAGLLDPSFLAGLSTDLDALQGMVQRQRPPAAPSSAISPVVPQLSSLPQAPQVPHLQAPAAAAPQQSSAVPSTLPPSAAPPASDGAQLARLEAALSALKPQVEAALLRGPGGANQEANVVDNFFGESGGGNGVESASPVSPLRNRRKMPQLNIATVAPAAQQAAAAGANPPHVDVKRLASEDRPQSLSPGQQPQQPQQVQALFPQSNSAPILQPPPQANARSPSGTVSAGPAPATSAASGVQPPVVAAREAASQQKPQQKEKGKSLSINVVRMAPTNNDPESPRSPGKYSAWK